MAALASAGALIGTEHFDPWGTLLSSSGTTTPFGFQGSDGSWTDPTTGFVSMGVRWYYPKVGRFLSSDPAAGTANPRTPMAGLRWTYALDSPLIHSDPTGLRIMYDGGAGNDPGPATDLCDRMSCPGSPYEAPTVYYAPPAPNKPKPPSCDWRCHLSNGWNALGQVTNIQPDAGGVQDNLIALGNHMDSGWKQRYRDTLSSSADWVNGTRGDLTSSDPYRIARGTVGVVIFSSNFVPGAGEGITLARNAGRVGINELVDHSPQIEQAVTKLAPKLKAEGENLLDRVVGSCKLNSFSASTTVLMADGSLKAIADIHIGDRVQAIDPLTGRPVVGTVTATYRNLDQQFADITVVGTDQKPHQLKTTQHHRFWDVTRQSWVFALDLAPGDELQAADGSLVSIVSVSTYRGSEVMYELTVDSVRDFYVVVSGMSILVHS